MLSYDLYSAYQVIHTWCQQNESSKRSMKLFFGNGYFNHNIGCKNDMKTFGLGSRENEFQGKKFLIPFFHP